MNSLLSNDAVSLDGDRSTNLASNPPSRVVGVSFMWVVCAWCGDEFATKECDPAVHGDVTHGVCSACKAAWIGRIPAQEVAA
jgi:hypothetical protein